MVIPAAANPMMLRTTHPTAAGMDRAVSKRTSFFQRVNCTKWWGWLPIITESLNSWKSTCNHIAVPDSG